MSVQSKVISYSKVGKYFCANFFSKILTERYTLTRFMTKIPYTAVDFDHDS